MIAVVGDVGLVVRTGRQVAKVSRRVALCDARLHLAPKSFRDIVEQRAIGRREIELIEPMRVDLIGVGGGV